MPAAPFPFYWDGKAMLPLNRQLADLPFVQGEVYRFVEFEDRSDISHGHLFAALREVWKNLPTHLAAEFPTPTAFRKFLLIKVGYCDKDSFVMATNKDALRLAERTRARDDYSIVTVQDRVVTIYTAKSQSRHAMARKEFQTIKQALLDEAAAMIGVSPESLSRNTGRAA